VQKNSLPTRFCPKGQLGNPMHNSTFGFLLPKNQAKKPKELFLPIAHRLLISRGKL